MTSYVVINTMNGVICSRYASVKDAFAGAKKLNLDHGKHETDFVEPPLCHHKGDGSPYQFQVVELEMVGGRHVQGAALGSGLFDN